MAPPKPGGKSKTGTQFLLQSQRFDGEKKEEDDGCIQRTRHPVSGLVFLVALMVTIERCLVDIGIPESKLVALGTPEGYADALRKAMTLLDYDAGNVQSFLFVCIIEMAGASKNFRADYLLCERVLEEYTRGGLRVPTSYNEESFVASEIEVHPINEDPIIYVDDEHGYVPNLPLLREDCYEIPSNGDIDAPFGLLGGPEVTTSEDVQQSTKANVEDFEVCYTFLTPNGIKVWCPNKGCDLKPTVGASYGSWSEVLRMYKNYAECSGFSVRVGQTKKTKAMRSFQVTDCKAHISVQVTEATSTFVIYKFVEYHNHPLVETYNRDFTKVGRKLSFSTKQFIHHMTLNNIGPTIAHRLQVSMKRGELRHVFWADEISKKNYEVFGDVLVFDATYYTNKCESSNASFKVNSSGANTLVQFILCYDTSIESQRYRQRLAEYKTTSRPYHSLSGLEIEKHDFEIYTHSIFLEIQKEIVKGKLFCYVSHTEQVQDKLVYFVTHLNKDNSVTNVFQVVTGPCIGNYNCSCRNFTRIGYLCRHIFCVFRVNRVVRIPDEYISKCWMKDVLPKRIFEIQYRYGVDNSPESLLRNEIFGLISNCVDSLRNDYDGLAILANKVRELSSNRSSDPVDSISKISNIEDIQNLVGGSLDVDLQCSNPQGIRHKGCGKSRRFIGPGEKAVEKVSSDTKALSHMPKVCNGPRLP
ncbi:hypothetical protein E3N88_34754 [Mikania micrantha]|uniref:SWIM-type domain-containing protein n=1 Tax=Mikania micrantha TaxID=192012 RepID=A0A5N6LZ21_9ASTR|nr:hypothetical protein E3N88_34754 [Mikania micrantha]